MRFHDLRHFFASILIAQGESAKYVQDQMGHSSIQVTFDTYGHLFPQSKQESVKKLDATCQRLFLANRWVLKKAVAQALTGLLKTNC